jgi:hypothetical protein
MDLDTLLSIAPWTVARRSEKDCLGLHHRLGLKDAVEFRVQEHGVSSLVFLNL